MTPMTHLACSKVENLDKKLVYLNDYILSENICDLFTHLYPLALNRVGKKGVGQYLVRHRTQQGPATNTAASH